MLEPFPVQTYRAGTLDMSVIICTRDRGDTLLPAVQSVLKDISDDGSAELLVIDQGGDSGVADLLAPILAKDSRLRYFHETTVGLSTARNAAMRVARGELVAFTDDDCTVEPGWSAALKETFAARPEVGIIFGHVERAEHDASKGFLPGFKAREGLLTRKRVFSGTSRWGIGANMALRRVAWERIGPFDELLGAGAPLKSSEDLDYVLRALHHRIGIYHSGRARVIHYGFRPQALVAGLIKGYALGCGAMYAKHVRSGDLFVTVLMVVDNGRTAWNIFRNALRGQRPIGANILIYGMKGIWRGLRLPLDRYQMPAGPVFLKMQGGEV